MNKSNIKLIVSDLDGTLLNTDHQLNPRFFEIFKQLETAGITFVVASGRQYQNLRKVFESIEDRIVFAAENGSYVLFQENEMHSCTLPASQIRELVTIGRQIPSANLVLCGKKSAYVENAEQGFIDHLSLYFEKFQVVNDLLSVDDEILKFTVCDLTGSEANSYPSFAHLSEHYQVKVSADTWLDISDRHAHKGNAVAMLQQHYGVSKEQTMVFGDYLNDLEMMHQGYFSYAMANGHPKVKGVARYIAKSNNEDGVLEVLERLVGMMALN
jgi:Cof subfamily protein (haloacid dehalogenase superfamily)